jgi:Family of unknown function (DUF6364)
MCDMNVTLSLDEEVVKEARKIAVDRDTTLTGLVREFLEALVAENAKSGRKKRELDALNQTFKRYSFKIGERNWTRADLHERS